jgi:hypothetical protein
MAFCFFFNLLFGVSFCYGAPRSFDSSKFHKEKGGKSAVPIPLHTRDFSPLAPQGAIHPSVCHSPFPHFPLHFTPVCIGAGAKMPKVLAPLEIHRFSLKNAQNLLGLSMHY